jgi:hypothetical protein
MNSAPRKKSGGPVLTFSGFGYSPDGKTKIEKLTGPARNRADLGSGFMPRPKTESGPPENLFRPFGGTPCLDDCQATHRGNHGSITQFRQIRNGGSQDLAFLCRHARIQATLFECSNQGIFPIRHGEAVANQFGFFSLGGFGGFDRLTALGCKRLWRVYGFLYRERFLDGRRTRGGFLCRCCRRPGRGRGAFSGCRRSRRGCSCPCSWLGGWRGGGWRGTGGR